MKINNLKKYILLIVLIISNSCGRNTYVLKNGKTRVAINQKVYKNKSKFDKSLLKQIDTLVIYEEFHLVSYEGLQAHQVNVVARNDNYGDHFYFAYRFYDNGCFNMFFMDKEKVPLKKEQFDPEYAGSRGIYYLDKGQIKGDKVVQVDGIGRMGKITETFDFKGDTLFVRKKNKWEYIYVKRKIPVELLNHHANW